MLCLHKFEILNNQPISIKFEDFKQTSHLMDEELRVRVQNLLESMQYEDVSRPIKPGKLYWSLKFLGMMINSQSLMAIETNIN